MLKCLERVDMLDALGTLHIHSWTSTTKEAKQNLSLVVRKSVFGVSDQVPHKSDCTATDGCRLEISDLGSRGIVISM